ncbi:hypothetical protein PUF88_04210 [Lactobacillaceae bacterium L1_55_11]|nr:hypothetical protein [Lactobacillaceae bacterium L1_55_11]
MLIPADRFRKILTIIFGALFAFLALEVRFRGTFVQVLDSLAALAVQNGVAPRLHPLLVVLGWADHFLVVLLATVLLYLFLRMVDYRLAANWFLVNQVVLVLLSLVLSVLIKLDYVGGWVLTGLMPDVDLLAWLYLLLNLVGIVFTRLFHNTAVRLVAVGVVTLFWLGLLLAQMGTPEMPLSSGLGALTLGYAWWQWQERLYRRFGKHWQQLFQIDGRL